MVPATTVADMSVDPPQRPNLSDVARELLTRTTLLGQAMAGHIAASVDAYRTGVIDPAILAQSCAEHIHFIATSLAESDVLNPDVAAETGRVRADQGVPLPDLMAAYTTGARWLWEQIAALALTRGLAAEEVVIAAAEVWRAQTDFLEAMATAYREVLTRKVSEREAERSALVGAVLDGSMSDQVSIWEAAAILGLSPNRPIVVVVAALPQPGRHALTGAREWLEGHSLHSAWALRHDEQVGLVHVCDDREMGVLVAALRGRGRLPIGVSPMHSGLSEARDAQRLARIAARSASPESPVAVLDERLVTVAAIGSPAVARRLQATVLGRVIALPDWERDRLLGTLLTWVEHGGSASRAAGVLYCHANTVRHRLKRLEELTGRSVTEPHALVELVLAAEAERATRVVA